MVFMEGFMFLKHLKNNYIIKKFIFNLTFLLIATLFFAGCQPSNKEGNVKSGQQNSQIVTKSPAAPSITPTVVPDGSAPSTIPDGQSTASPSGVPSDSTDNANNQTLNNGGLYVNYRGSTYYRQYTKDSYSPTGLWGDYAPIADVAKNMIRSNEDGTTAIAFSDIGAGPIYISNDRMYLEKPTQNSVDIYSISIDGSDPKEFGAGKICGIDEATGTVVCLLSGPDNLSNLALIHSATGDMVKPVLSTPCQKVLTIHEGIIYYQGVVEYEQSCLGKMKLCRVNIDGTDEQTIAETDATLYEYATYGTEIPCFQFIDHTIYFSYGGYSGTGYFYQGGRIAKVDIDGSNFEILLGIANDIDIQGNVAPENFYIAKDNDNFILYYTDEMLASGATYALDLNKRKLIPSAFAPVNPEGEPFEYNGGVSIYQNSSPTLTSLIPKVDYSSLGFEDSQGYKYQIKDIEICGNWIYYKLDANEFDADASIGWRDGYQRIKTQMIRQKLGETKKEILYEY